MKQDKDLENDQKNCQCDNEKCHCSEHCDCGDDCHCDENDKCNDDCTCEEKCHCGDDCECGENCDCDGNCDCKKGGNCKCSDKCDCGDDCNCDENNKCNDDCDCKKDKHNCCHCEEGEEECGCGHHKHHKHEKRDEPDYLALAQRIQAEFENYRRRMHDQLTIERQEGVVSVIDVFLPCLDTFKEAKKRITDEKVLEGVNMIESKIMNALNKLEVEKIEAVGQKFDPNFHDVIAVMHNENYDDDIILEEYQAGYKYKGKVIRYSKVIVNKKEGN